MIDPVVNEKNAFSSLPAEIRLENKTDKAMVVNGQFSDQQGLRFDPALISEEVKAGSEKTIQLIVNSISQKMEISKLDKINLELTAAFNDQLKLSSRKTLTLDWLHECPSHNMDIQLDGKLSDWENVPFVEVKQPQYVKEGWDWKGISDGWFRFALVKNNNTVYLALEATDDRFLIHRNDPDKKQDQFFIHLDPSYNSKSANPQNIQKFSILHGNKPSEALNERAIKLKTKLSSGHFIAECILPLKEWTEKTSGETGFRLNIGYMDHDNPQNTKPSVLWWRPPWDHNLNYENSGVFVLDHSP